MDKLLKELKALDKDLPDLIDKVVQANASEMAQTARRLAPIDTGALRRSIRKQKTGELQAKVRAGARYAPYMEFGTGGYVEVPAELQDIAIRFKGAGVKRIDIRPKPFMYPALKLQEPQLVHDMEKAIASKLRKI